MFYTMTKFSFASNEYITLTIIIGRNAENGGTKPRQEIEMTEKA